MSDWQFHAGTTALQFGSNFTLGPKFRVTGALNLTAIGIRSAEFQSKTHTLTVWDTTTGLAVVTVSATLNTGGWLWFSVTPFGLVPNREYIITFFNQTAAVLLYEGPGTANTYTDAATFEGITLQVMGGEYSASGNTYPVNHSTTDASIQCFGLRGTAAAGSTSKAAADTFTLAESTRNIFQNRSAFDAFGLADATPAIIQSRSIATSDAGNLLEAATRPVLVSDAGNLLEAASLALQATRSDVGNLLETASLALQASGSDGGSVSETTILNVVVPTTALDAAAVSDLSGAIAVTPTTRTDAGTVAELAAALVQTAETGATQTLLMTETVPLIAVSLSRLDAAAMADIGSINTGVNPSAIDAATLLEPTKALTATVTGTDSATLLDLTATPIEATDAASMTDASQIVPTVTVIDTGTLADVAAPLTVAVTGSDGATLAELPSITQTMTATDNLSVDDVSTITVGDQPFGAESFGLAEAVALTVTTQATQAAALAEATGTAQARADTAALAEARVLAVSPTARQDFGSLTETSLRAASEGTTTGDNATLAESASINATRSAQDALVFGVEQAIGAGSGSVSAFDTATLTNTVTGITLGLAAADGATVQDISLNLNKPVLVQDAASMAEVAAVVGLARLDAGVMAEALPVLALARPDAAQLGEATAQVLVTFLLITAEDAAALAEGAALMVELEALDFPHVDDRTGRADATVFAVRVRLLPPAVEVRTVTDVAYLVGGQRDIAVEVIPGRKGLTLPAITAATFTVTQAATGGIIAAGTCTVIGTTVTAFVEMPVAGVYRLEFTMFVGPEKVVHRVEVGVAA